MKTGERKRYCSISAQSSAVLLSAVVMFLAACGNENRTEASAGDSSKSDSPAVAGTTQPNVERAEQPDRKAVNVARTDGEITAVVKGGLSKWYVTHQFHDGENSSASEWRNRTASTISVTVVGHKMPTTTVVSGSGEIVLDFIIPDINLDRSAAESRIDYFPMGLANTYSSDAGGKASVVLQKAELKGDLLELEGTFSGSLPFVSQSGKKAPAGMTEFTIEKGVFSAKIHKE